MACKIYIASDRLLVSNLHSLLERSGIAALTQQSAVDAPPGDELPLVWCSELWVLRDGQVSRALRLLKVELAGSDSPGFEQLVRPVMAPEHSAPPPAATG